MQQSRPKPTDLSDSFVRFQDPQFLTQLISDADKKFIPGYEVTAKLEEFKNIRRILDDKFSCELINLSIEIGDLLPIQDIKHVIPRKIKYVSEYLFSDMPYAKSIIPEEKWDLIQQEEKCIKLAEKIFDEDIEPQTLTFTTNQLNQWINKAVKKISFIDQFSLCKLSLAANHPKELLEKMVNIPLSKEGISFAKKNNIPLDIMQKIIAPRGMALQCENLIRYIQTFQESFPRLQEWSELGEDNIFRIASHVQFKDKKFPTWNANLVENSNFAIGQGPCTEEDLELLFDNTAFNADCRINNFVALGASFPETVPKGQRFDFLNYFLFEKLTEKIIGKYKIKVTDASDGYLNLLKDIEEDSSQSRSANVTLLVTHRETGEEQIVKVNYFKLIDNHSIDLNNEEDFSRLYQIYKLSEKEKFYFHCHAGVGRAGHTLLSIFLAKKISAGTPFTVQEVLKIVDQIRKDRPGAVWTLEQFRVAVQTAIQILVHERGIKSRLALSIYGNRGSMSSLKAKSQEIQTIDHQDRAVKHVAQCFEQPLSPRCS